MRNLLTLNFWFSSRPDFFTKIGLYGLLIFIGILLVGGVACIFLAKKHSAKRKLFNGLSSFGITNGFIGLLLMFFSYELIPLLSSRFWFIIWLGVMIFWGYMIYRGQKKIMMIKQQLSPREQEIKKYIP